MSVPRPPFDLMLDGLPFGRVVSYDYDQPWAMGRFEPADPDAHRRLVEGCELRREIEDWPDLPGQDDDHRWAEALLRRGITDDDVDRLHGSRWTIRWEGEEREVFAQEFDRQGFFTWRW